MQRPVPLLFQTHEIAGGGAKEKLRDREMDLVAVRGEGDVHVDQNYRS